MKRSKCNTDLRKKIKASTSTKQTDSESDNSENAEEVTIKQYNYKTYFKYKIKNDDKVGLYLLYQEKNLIKEIKMKNSNTTGLKKHLEKNHKEAYKNLFGEVSKDKTLPKKQKVIDVFLNVSTKNKLHKL